MRLLPLFALCAGLLATTQANAWDRNKPIVPVDVAVNCAATNGVTAPIRLSYPYVAYATTVRVLPGFGVTEEKAAHINACIASFTGLRGRDVPEVATVGGFGIKVRRERCPAVMTGGSSYCVKDTWN